MFRSLSNTVIELDFAAILNIGMFLHSFAQLPCCENGAIFGFVLITSANFAFLEKM